MPTCSVYIDAGYLLASAATRVAGTSLRSSIQVEFAQLILDIQRTAQQQSGLPLLRAYWYDSAKNGVPDARQERIGALSKVKLRLGRFGVEGQQKGVDLRIGLDLAGHARNRASDVFVLVSGDGDLTEAVEEAQAHGVQVIVLAVPTADDQPHGVSRHLIMAADDLDVIPGSIIDTAIARAAAPAAAGARAIPQAQTMPTAEPARTGEVPDLVIPSPRDLARPKRASTTPTSTLAYTGSTNSPGQVLAGFDQVDETTIDPQIDAVVNSVVNAFRQSASPEDLSELRRGKPSIPRDLDRALLTDLSEALGISDLNDQVRYRLRGRFWHKIDQGS